MTNREFLVAISNNEAISEELRQFAQESIEKLDAKLSSRATKEAEKRAEENAPLFAKIRELFVDHKALTTAEVAEALEVHTSKASALLRKMADNNELVATDVKVPKKGKVKSYSIKE